MESREASKLKARVRTELEGRLDKESGQWLRSNIKENSPLNLRIKLKKDSH